MAASPAAVSESTLFMIVFLRVWMEDRSSRRHRETALEPVDQERTSATVVKRLLRDPLLHFLLLGAALFLFSRWQGEANAAGEGPIVVSPARIESLAAGFARTWLRSPTRAELERLTADWVREEVAVREARAMGLEEGDTVVRRRLRQKLEFLAEGLAPAGEPADEELRAFLEEHEQEFRLEASYALRHVYVSRERRGDAAQADARALLIELERTGPAADISATGDALPLPEELEPTRAGEIAGLFGQGFADALAELEPGRWCGPLESAYGLHLVLVRERSEGRLPALEEVRAEVLREWEAARREELRDAFYARLLERHQVIVQWPEEPPAVPAEAGR